MTAAEVLSLVGRAFPLAPRPAAGDLAAHSDGCALCEYTTEYLLDHPGPSLPAEAIRWLCDELSTLSPAATVWVLASFLRYVLTEVDLRDRRPTECLIDNLGPAPEDAADARARLSHLTGEQVGAVRAVVRHLAETPYWADYCGQDLDRAAAFLATLPG